MSRAVGKQHGAIRVDCQNRGRTALNEDLHLLFSLPAELTFSFNLSSIMHCLALAPRHF